MILLLLVFSVLFLSFTNGANDNFKGVATLLGSQTVSYRQALIWATVTTFAGSLTATFLSGELVRAFSGKGLVPSEILTLPFLTSVGLGAALTVMFATQLGFPISTTHSLVGALIGAGIAALPNAVQLNQLGQAFFWPLIISPILALSITALLYPLLRWVRLRWGIQEETCVCIDADNTSVPSQAAAIKSPGLSLNIDSTTACKTRSFGRIFNMSAQKMLDYSHFLSSGVVCFARGLNDTPKIVGLLAGAHFLNLHWGMLLVGLSMALGGWIGARKVAETMSYRITDMNHGQGFTANLVTSAIVLGASKMGIPVSTTHVSCGALFGMGLTTHQAHWSSVKKIILSWFITLPVAALCSGLIWIVLNHS